MDGLFLWTQKFASAWEECQPYGQEGREKGGLLSFLVTKG